MPVNAPPASGEYASRETLWRLRGTVVEAVAVAVAAVGHIGSGPLTQCRSCLLSCKTVPAWYTTHTTAARASNVNMTSAHVCNSGTKRNTAHTGRSPQDLFQMSHAAKDGRHFGLSESWAGPLSLLHEQTPTLHSLSRSRRQCSVPVVDGAWGAESGQGEIGVFTATAAGAQPVLAALHVVDNSRNSP